VIAGKGVDADERVIEPLEKAGKRAVILPKANRKREHDKELYKARHLIEKIFAKLKQFRAIATRFDNRTKGSTSSATDSKPQGRAFTPVFAGYRDFRKTRRAAPAARTAFGRRRNARAARALRASSPISRRCCAAPSSMPMRPPSWRLTGSSSDGRTRSGACSRNAPGPPRAPATITAGPMPSSQTPGCSPCTQPGAPRDTPDEETTDWRTVCGKTARAVRSAGRRNPSRPLSDPMGWRVVRRLGLEVDHPPNLGGSNCPKPPSSQCARKTPP
jgi:hypothetical protein